MNSKYISDYVYLAEASYTDFSKGYDTSSVKKALEDKNNGKQSESFAKLVTQNYTVEAHWEDKAGDGVGSLTSSESGFSGTLFRSIGDNGSDSGRYVLALKGTAGAKDLAVVDGGDIVHDGLAHHQIVDLYNFWQQIKGDKNNGYQVADIRSDLNLTLLYSASKVINFSDFLIEQGLKGKGYFIDSGTIKQIVIKNSHDVYDVDDARYNGFNIAPGKVVVSGHSLGGHLTAAFSRLFHDETEHAYMVNGAGFGAKFNPVGNLNTNQAFNIHEIFSFLGGKDSFDKDMITNITGDKNINFVAQDWLIGLKQPGEQPEIFIESGIFSVLGHGSDQISDSMVVMDLFMRIDTSLQNEEISAIFKKTQSSF